MKLNMARPTDYNQDIVTILCKELAKGRSLRSICREEDMPDLSTVFDWLAIHKEFTEQYARAKEESADADMELIEEIGDTAIQEAKDANPKSANAVVSAYKLKSDNLRWGMSKKKPKKYGDKLDMTTNGKDLPTPILNGVSIHHSDKENPQAQ